MGNLTRNIKEFDKEWKKSCPKCETGRMFFYQHICNNCVVRKMEEAKNELLNYYNKPTIHHDSNDISKPWNWRR